MNIKFYLNRLPEIIVYYLTFKKYYLCDGCSQIHKRQKDDIVLEQKYGLLESSICAVNTRNRVIELLNNAIFHELRR